MSSIDQKLLNYVFAGFILIVFRLQLSEAFPKPITNELNCVDVPKNVAFHPVETNITKFEKPEVRCCGNSCCGFGCAGNCGCGCECESCGCGNCGCGGCGDGMCGRSNNDGVYAYPVYVPVVYIVDNSVEAGSGVGYNAFGASTRFAGYGANEGYGNGGYGAGYGGACACGYSGGAPRCGCGTYTAYGNSCNHGNGNSGYGGGGFGKK